jgi:hypothetical protein
MPILLWLRLLPCSLSSCWKRGVAHGALSPHLARARYVAAVQATEAQLLEAYLGKYAVFFSLRVFVTLAAEGYTLVWPTPVV